MTKSYPPPPKVGKLTEAVARLLCEQINHDPDDLEPGDAYGVDHVLPNGDPAHYLWRQHVDDAREVIALVKMGL